MTTAVVQDFMTPNPFTVKPSDSIETAIKLMEEKQVRGLPVVDAVGKLVGLITEADLIVREAPLEPPVFLTLLGSVIYFESPEKFHHHLQKTLGMQVQDVMTAKPITTTPTTPISEVAQAIVHHHISRLPVLDETGGLVGIITRHDLMQALKA